MKNNILFSAFLLLLIQCLPNTVSGHVNTYLNYRQGSDIAIGTSNLQVKDEWYQYMVSSSDWNNHPQPATPLNDSTTVYGNKFANRKAIGRVSFQYTGSQNIAYSSTWTATVTYNIVGYAAGGAVLFNKTGEKLILNYGFPTTSSIVAVYDKSVLEYQKVHFMDISITGITLNGSSLTALNNDFILEASIEVERYFILNPATVPTITKSVNTTLKTVDFAWPFVLGAEEYELQFVHVSDQLTSGTTALSQRNYANATKIFLNEQTYKMTLPYERGVLYYRVRPVGRHGKGFSERFFGSWSTEGTVNIFTTGGDVTPFENGRNWTCHTTYAEHGKRAQDASFFDGTGQNRQSVTKDNSTNFAMVAENFVDFEGRPAVNVMPTPALPSSNLSGGSIFKFYEDYCLAFGASGGLFSKDYFDLNSNRQNPKGLATTTASGGATTAGNFFSQNNPLISSSVSPLTNYGMNQAIPKATTSGNESFAYSRVLYDDHGRVAEESAIGPDHKIGSGHTIKYYYGGVGQEKLDRLFGPEVGYAEHYSKKMIKDPNGQLTVQYENLSGQLVASAYVGNVPLRHS
ncbi:MAG: hypothetical protein IPN76_03250 [Saprospiraceae bacterium]|nr:hypothetical protein [Saprospiraceae bacterium]